jgi:hypothetical protein
VAWVLIDAEGVIAVHDRVLNPGELAGLAGGRSLEGARSPGWRTASPMA